MLTKKMCFISPWPPHEGGVAIHSYEVVLELMKYDPSISITVITVCDNPKPLPGVNIITALTRSDLPDFSQFCKIIHVITNSVYTNISFELLPEIGGIVLTHETNVHSWVKVNVGLCEKGFRWDSYKFLATLATHSIWKKSRFLWKALIKEFGFIWCLKNIRIKSSIYKTISSLCMKMHCMDMLTKHAQQVVCLSEVNKERIHQLTRFPLDKISTMRFGFKPKPDVIREKPPQEIDRFVFGLFGVQGPQKQYDLVINAFDLFYKIVDPQAPVFLHIVGEYSDTIVNCISAMSLCNKIKLVYRPHDEQWNRELEDIDCLIALRYPTCGEASGPVSQAAQKGVVSIVNDNDWFSSLPTWLAYKILLPSKLAALIDAMEKAYQGGNSVLLEKRKKYIREKAQDYFSLQQGVQELALAIGLKRKEQKKALLSQR